MRKENETETEIQAAGDLHRIELRMHHASGRQHDQYRKLCCDQYGEVSVIFTHDMHSHMDADRVSKDGKVVEAGGFGKLKTAMDEVRSDYPDSFVLDGAGLFHGNAVSDDFFQGSFRAENDEVFGV